MGHNFRFILYLTMLSILLIFFLIHVKNNKSHFLFCMDVNVRKEINGYFEWKCKKGNNQIVYLLMKYRHWSLIHCFYDLTNYTAKGSSLWNFWHSSKSMLYNCKAAEVVVVGEKGEQTSTSGMTFNFFFFYLFI